MKHRAGLTGHLRVTVEFHDAARRSLTVRWSPDDEIAAGRRLEYARLFVVTRHELRMYLDIVDGTPWARVRLPDPLAVGEYSIEVDAYGSASWGDGRLAARGRSGSFPVR
ncbi:hypothetical protein [Nocardia sp. NPDC048505]|uniref:hypothetical protein n=1 Tax=unclassified Nocardia TaxID=2637762 RepID=UPI0033D5D7F0